LPSFRLALDLPVEAVDYGQGDDVMRAIMGMALALVIIGGCQSEETLPDTEQVKELATRYTAAWCSLDPARVAALYAEEGSLTINAGAPSVGRAAITEAARGFMTAYPDMVVEMDGIVVDGNQAVYRWTFRGTNTGPGGTGNAVLIGGHEEWTIGPDGLIEESRGHYDEADWERQLNAGMEGS
jgi:uncharacterized protein (TIGR02246 family)